MKLRIKLKFILMNKKLFKSIVLIIGPVETDQKNKHEKFKLIN